MRAVSQAQPPGQRTAISRPNKSRCVAIITAGPRPCRPRERSLKEEIRALLVFSLGSFDSSLLPSYAAHPSYYLSSSLPELVEVSSLPSLIMSQPPSRDPSPKPQGKGFLANFARSFTGRKRQEGRQRVYHEFLQEPGHQSVEVLTAENLYSSGFLPPRSRGSTSPGSTLPPPRPNPVANSPPLPDYGSVSPSPPNYETPHPRTAPEAGREGHLESFETMISRPAPQQPSRASQPLQPFRAGPPPAAGVLDSQPSPESSRTVSTTGAASASTTGATGPVSPSLPPSTPPGSRSPSPLDLGPPALAPRRSFPASREAAARVRGRLQKVQRRRWE